MKIVIIANFTRALDGEREGRFSYLAEEFSQRGHDVEMIITDFSHGKKAKRPTPRYDLYKWRITMLHEPGYRKNVSPQRLYSHYVWGKNVYKYLKKIEKPDVIYCAVPSLSAADFAAKYCRKNHVRFVTDVQDLWPEAFCMAIRNKLLQKAFLPMYKKANRIYASSDLAVAVSDTYVDRTLSVNKKGIQGVSVFLGNNGELFDSQKGEFKVERNGNEILLCYIGSMSNSYDIECVIDALDIINQKNLLDVDVRFVLIGNGPYRERFESYAKAKSVNCTFLGAKPYAEMASLLSSCDICMNPIAKGSAASIINKVGDYALSGLPVVNTQENLEYRRLVEEYGCGVNCKCGDSEAVASAIVMLSKDVNIRKGMGIASRKLAEDLFNRRNTYLRIINAIESL